MYRKVTNAKLSNAKLSNANLQAATVHIGNKDMHMHALKIRVQTAPAENM